MLKTMSTNTMYVQWDADFVIKEFQRIAIGKVKELGHSAIKEKWSILI